MCFELATTEIDREVYAKRAGFKNGSHLRASLPINKFKYKAIGYVGLFALPASAMVYLVGKKLINTFERKRVGEPGSAC